MRRGDIRPILLKMLSSGGPGHGYELIRRLEESSGGLWRPSPGSIYPILQLLEDEGAVRSTENDGKRVYEVTDVGRAEAKKAMTVLPWEQESSMPAPSALQLEARQLQLAVRQVAVAGDRDTVARATALIRETRQAIYRILAEH